MNAQTITILPTLNDLAPLMERACGLGSEQARVHELCYHVISDPSLKRLPSDPFSVDYRQAILDLHARISERPEYDPSEHERLWFDVDDRAKRPSIFRDGNSQHLGMYLEAQGQILQRMNVAPGAKILEYGPGDGQLALPLARMGCDVTVIDIEERYLRTIEKQAEMLATKVTTIHGEFIGDYGLADFDRVLFFETFHHAIDHVELLTCIRDILKPDGKIIFAGEPIIADGDFWSPVVPFPWGLRLDALSLSAVRSLGWMELGFRESYFKEALRRTGWKMEKLVSTTNGRGTCYIASRA